MTYKTKIASVAFYLILFLACCLTNAVAQEKGVLSLSFNVISNRAPINEAAVKFTSAGKEVELSLTQDNGRYTTIVPFDNEYFITIGKENFVPKIIKVNSRIPEKFKKAFFYSKIAIELFSNYDKSANQTALQEPYAFVKFNEALSNFEIEYNQKIKKEDHKAKEIAAMVVKKAASQESVDRKITAKTTTELPEQSEIAEKPVDRQNVTEAEKTQGTPVEITAEKEKPSPIKSEKKRAEELAISAKEIKTKSGKTTRNLNNARLDDEEKAAEETKRLKLENESRTKKITDAKAQGAEEEERQLKLKLETDKKILAEKNQNTLEQNRLNALNQVKDQSSDEAKERARKETAEHMRLMELERLKAEAQAKQLSEKAKEEVRKREEEEARLARIEDEKQALAKRKAKEAELAAKKAFEADLERKQKKLAMEKDDKLKEKEVADLIVEYNTYPKGHTENFEGYKVFRIVKKENEHSYHLYKRTTYTFGEYFFHNNRSITENTFIKDTHITE